MLIPRFWAEARLQERRAGKQRTVRRFGWSNASQADAEALAQSRAREALERVFTEEALPRREPKIAYGGAEGLPIREEIVAEHGRTILTRNSYGAICLNTPNVLFVDIDFPVGPSSRLLFACFLVLLAAAGVAGALSEFRWVYIVGVIITCFGFYPLALLLHRVSVTLAGGVERQAVRRIERFVASQADWRARLYRTPAGLRLLALHAVFEPGDAEAVACFAAVRADPVYVRMCINQQCFRARLTPKPWRIGMTERMKPRPGIWPVNPTRLPERAAWIQRYEEQARGYAACHFVADLGLGTSHPEAAAVQRLHDERCRAESGLPLA